MPGDNAKHIFGERVPYEETVAPFSQYPFDLHFTQVSAGFPITRAPQASGLEKAAALDRSGSKRDLDLLCQTDKDRKGKIKNLTYLFPKKYAKI